jgi:TolA-binding protein
LKDNSNISQDLLETVERYHKKIMTQDERLSFEARLQTDNEFKILVDDIQTLLFGIEKQALKEKLHEFHNDLPIQLKTTKKESKVSHFHFMKIAATVVIFIAVGSFWFLSGSSNERLFDNYFTPDPGLPTTMSSSDNFNFYDAMVNYKQGEYDKAIAKWEVLQKNQPENDTINYFLGVAQLANQHEAQAINYLDAVTKNSESHFRNDAYYYLGLAYLKADNIELAKKNLNFSTVDNSKELLSELED